jgi:hypothetical protein
VIPSSATAAGEQHRGQHHVAEFVGHDQCHAGKAEHQAQPLPRRYPFSEQEACTTRREQRLHADYQCRDAGRQTVLDGHEYPAEIDGMHQQAGHADVNNLAHIGWPRRAGGQRKGGHQREHQQVAGEQESQGFGVRQAEFGADETSTPQEDKKKRQQ